MYRGGERSRAEERGHNIVVIKTAYVLELSEQKKIAKKKREVGYGASEEEEACYEARLTEWFNWIES